MDKITAPMYEALGDLYAAGKGVEKNTKEANAPAAAVEENISEEKNNEGEKPLKKKNKQKAPMLASFGKRFSKSF